MSERSNEKGVDRRQLLTASGGALSVALLKGYAPAAAAQNADEVLFTHGVASGDPLADRVILWTRVVPADGRDRKIDVTWQIASDENFDELVTQGRAKAGPAADYTVKVDAAGLSPDQSYFYRFTAGGHVSAVGRTNTLPATGTADVRLAVVSCSNYPQGYFHVYREIAGRDVAAVLHLGDYIYEYPAGRYSNEKMTQEHGREVKPKGEVIALDDYRMRYGLYRSDPDLQTVHAAHPFICVWDDHEITNDTWKTGAENHNEGEGPFEERKKAALQAYHEWLPIRERADGDRNKIYRSFELGDLATLIMLDTRLVGRDKPLTYGADLPLRSITFRFEPGKTPVAVTDAKELETLRADTKLRAQLKEIPVPFRVSGKDAQPLLEWSEIEAIDPKNMPEGLTYLPDMPKFQQEILPAENRSMLGSDQENWLEVELAQSKASGKVWQILGQQVLSGKVGIPMISDDQIDKTRDAYIGPKQIAQFRMLSAMGLPLNLDAWDGYPAARNALFESLEKKAVNPVLLAGDTHNAWAFNLSDETGTPVGVEFATAGVSSPGMEEYLPVEPSVLAGAIKEKSPELQFLESSHRGWLELNVSLDAITADFRFVSTVRDKAYNLLPVVSHSTKAGSKRVFSP